MVQLLQVQREVVVVLELVELEQQLLYLDLLLQELAVVAVQVMFQVITQ